MNGFWRHHKHLYIVLAGVVIIGVLVMLYIVQNNRPEARITSQVDTGLVREVVSVSGIAKAEQSANLAFPVTGIVNTVLVDEGDVVTTGDTLVILDTTSLLADRQDAVAAVAQAIASRDELVTGPTDSSRAATTETVAQAEQALTTTRANEARKVENAYQALLSSNLAAYSTDPNEDAVTPTVSGTYTCDTEGQYVLDMYTSAAESGYSFHLSGLESGTYIAATEQPGPLGTCGLEVQFDEDSVYGRTTWIIDIPNTRAATYVSNRNAYTLAATQADSAIASAKQALSLATANANNINAPARDEATTRANAAITQARARLARIDAELADRTLQAPFSGTITALEVTPGETVTTAPILTLLASSEFEVTARVPEIDIGKLELDQRVEMIFDARDNETLKGTITFISLQATEIDGVAYYEAIITPDTVPSWMRSGLNADIEIVVRTLENTLRVPNRFLLETDTGYSVYTQHGEAIVDTPIDVILRGNNGYAAVTGLDNGNILVAP